MGIPFNISIGVPMLSGWMRFLLTICRFIIGAFLFLVFTPLWLHAQTDDSSPIIHILKNLPPPAKMPAVFKKGQMTSEQRRHFTVYDAGDGLALSSVAKILPDREGNLWMTTTGGGVSRFDGRQFFTYNVNHGLGLNVVRGIAQDSLSNFWFATQGGLTYFDGFRFTTYTTKDGLVNDAVYDVSIDAQQRVWAGTLGGGISMYADRKFTNYTSKDGLVSDFVRCLYHDKLGRLWIGTNSGVSLMIDQKFIDFPESHQLANLGVYSITDDHAGNIWFATSAGLVKYDHHTMKRYTTADGLPDNLVLSVKEDRNGNLWAGTHEGGVCRFDGKKFEVFNMSSGLPNNRVWSIAEDKNGALWFATQGGGICRYEGESLTLFDARQGMVHSKVWTVTQDSAGFLWIGTDHGISRFDGRTFDNLMVGATQPENLINSITVVEKGKLWFATASGAVYYDGRQLHRYTTAQGLPDSRIRKIIVTADGSVWFGTLSGLARMKGDSIIQYTTRQGLASNNVRSLMQDRNGTIWITTSGGISAFDGKHFRNFTAKNGLHSNMVTRMHEDKAGNIWFGTHGEGLMRYDGKTFLDIGTRHAIPDGVVYGVVSDHNDNVWIGTNHGFIKLVFKKNNKVIPVGNSNVSNAELDNYTFVWEQFNRETNYPLDDLNSGAIFFLDRLTPFDSSENQNTLWGGFGNNFLVRLKPQVVRRSSSSELRIRNIRLNGREVSWNSLIDSKTPDSSTLAQQEFIHYGKILSQADRDTLRQFFSNISITSITPYYLLPENLVLPYAHNNLTFEFNAIEVDGNNRIRYQFKLDGQDDDWSAPASKTEATFNNLWEGQYTFNVRYLAGDGEWREPQSFRFTIRPPLWRTWWMILFYLLSLVTLVWMLIHLRVKMLKREKRILENIIRERTHEAVSQKEEADRQRTRVEEMNEEITMQLNQIERDLSEQTLQMIHRHNTLTEIEAEIKNSAAGLEPKQLNKLLQLVSINKSLDKEWDTFNNYFANVHKEFYQKLRSVTSGLSIHDQRLAALVKMSLENREIATLLNIEVGSVKMAKYRLKKKIGLNEGDDLFEFISGL
jgi:ligand-binding sensor domain-containing protein/DNA-binding CsgD family transcriptional regulator